MNTNQRSIPRALTIAGSDSGGGAGIQADLKTFSAFGVHGMTAITAVTAQNTRGVQASLGLPLDIIEKQVRSVASDIGVDAVKTGMLSSEAVAGLVCDLLADLRLPNLVVDPVMIAKGGHPLLSKAAVDTVRRRLLPLAMVFTPNLDEAAAMLGHAVTTLDDMREAARQLGACGPRWVVVKGGHLDGGQDAIDLVFDGSTLEELRAPRRETPNTHGTGCVFSAAITAGLARGISCREAIHNAKRFVTRAIETSLAIGHGHGPVNPLADVASPWMPSPPTLRN